MFFLKRIATMFKIFWRLLRVFWQMLYGSWKISRLDSPIITIFGGAHFKFDDPYALQAQQLGLMFVKNDISVLTGGGRGIMGAVGYGAMGYKDGKGKSIGIGVKDLNEGSNSYVSEYIELNYFFARKWLLTRFSLGFVVFPGGFGTLDEMSEILTLIQTRHMRKLPIVLIGVEYWQPWFDWLNNEALRHGAVTVEAIALFTITDDLQQAFSLVCEHCRKI